MDFQELQNSIKDITEREAKIAAEKKQIRSNAITMVQDLVNTFDIKPDEIDFSGNASSKPSRKRSAPKYQHPLSAQTWSGRGRQPQWVRNLAGEGLTLEDCIIEKQQAAAPAADE